MKVNVKPFLLIKKEITEQTVIMKSTHSAPYKYLPRWYQQI